MKQAEVGHVRKYIEPSRQSQGEIQLTACETFLPHRINIAVAVCALNLPRLAAGHSLPRNQTKFPSALDSGPFLPCNCFSRF
jgi:hypothetical protein